MSGSTKQLLAIAVVLAVAACTDLANTSDNTLALGPAFQTVPAGFSANSNSFDASGDAGEAFFPGSIEKGRKHRDDFGDGWLRGLLMGGGLGPDFIGGIPFGKGRGRGPFGWYKLPEHCTFDSATGRVTCPETTKHELKVNVSYAFEDVEGVAQAKFDTVTTNSVNVKVDVSGTKAHRKGATSTLAHASDRTIGGLAKGSTQRTVDGTAKAHESTTGTREGISFTAVRDAGDTTRNVVISIVEGKPTIPTSGTVIRAMTVSITPDGGTATTKSRREEITFDGTNVIKVKITQDGQTKNCTITLPSKKLVCE